MRISKCLLCLSFAVVLALALGSAFHPASAEQVDPKDPKANWNQIYDAPGYIFGTEPIPFLVDYLPLVRRGKALELAMGEGRNAVYLAQQGFQVTGVDISEVAAEKCRRLAAKHKVEVEIVIADLREYTIPPNTYDLITNLYFPQPDLVPKIKAALKPGGFIMYEQWRPVREGQGYPGEASGGGSGGNVYQYSDLGREELLSQFQGWRIHIYREAMLNHAAAAGPGRGILMSEVMSLVAQKPFD